MFKRSFYLQPTLEVANALIGSRISTVHRGKLCSGMIVETEAYHGTGDMACHSYYGRSARNEVMFARGGHCYVYLIYGMHFCVNVVTEDEGTGSAVLIRAIEPLEGSVIMQRRRGYPQGKEVNLTNGPAKLCQALAIDRKFNGEDFLTSEKISLSRYKRFSKSHIISATRIGISKSKELPWRFYLKNNPWVSKN